MKTLPIIDQLEYERYKLSGDTPQRLSKKTKATITDIEQDAAKTPFERKAGELIRQWQQQNHRITSV
jgi:hypothetical protein